MSLRSVLGLALLEHDLPFQTVKIRCYAKNPRLDAIDCISSPNCNPMPA